MLGNTSEREVCGAPWPRRTAFGAAELKTDFDTGSGAPKSIRGARNRVAEIEAAELLSGLPN
eukprot:4004824-Alexandrium_andersonii.AAC.1